MKNKSWLRWLILAMLLVVILVGGWWFWADYQKRMTFRPEGQIAYECWPDGASRICVINADGTAYRQITFNGTVYQPAWSPDGSRLLYVSQPSLNAADSVFVMSADGTGIKQLTDRQCASESPSWSPKSEEIAFVKYDDNKICKGVAGIYLMHSDGSNQRRLTDRGEQPMWSPDGSKIAYIYENNVYLLNLDDLLSTKASTTFSHSPTWSPDGKQIAFVCSLDDALGICVVNSDGTGRRVILHDASRRLRKGLSWSPDGEYIAYSTTNPLCILCNITGLIWITKADGSYQKQLTEGCA